MSLGLKAAGGGQQIWLPKQRKRGRKGEREGKERSEKDLRKGEGGAWVCERVSKASLQVFYEELWSGMVELEMVVNLMKKEEESKKDSTA
ncbi:hypothetical protein SLA2020_286150 [Shorea laevis]